MRKFILLITFFSTAPLAFIFVLLLFFLVTYNGSSNQRETLADTKHVAFAALPTSQNVFNEAISSKDARAEILRQFFARYNSPLEPYAQHIVDEAEAYGLDFRLLPAIAMQESNLCTKNRPESHNCWGFGVYGGKYTYFDNYSQAIDTISRTLAVKYRNKNGLVTPDEIQKMYTPSNNGSWAYSVNHFMATLQ